jgi:probable rRNA maturation factor
MNSQIANELQVEICVQDCFSGCWAQDGLPEIEAQELFSRTHDDQVISAELWESWFHRWLEILQTELPAAPAYELSLRLTDDQEIQTLNAQYRQKNHPTDVLAFASLEVNYPKLATQCAEMPLYLGDIVISVETANNQAQQQKHSLKTELTWLAAHGLLHLLGWDHPDEESLLSMLDQQRVLLEAIGVSTTSIATS